MANVYQSTLAQILGLSQSTVSRALRGDPRVRPETRARIEEESRKLGYRPDPWCAALARHSHRNDRLGERPTLVVATITKASLDFSDLAQLAALAGERGFELQSVCLGESRAAQEQILKRLWRNAVRGIFLYEAETPNARIFADLKGFEVVVLYPELTNPRSPRLLFDHFSSIERVFDEIAARGYRRPGLWLDQLHDKVKGWYPWRAAFALLGTLRFEIAPMSGGTSVEMLSWVKRKRIDCLVTFGSGKQQLAWKAEGIVLPREIGLCGLDVDDPAEGGRVSGIVQHRELILEHALWLMEIQLHQRLAGRRQPPATILLSGAWVEGETLRSQSEGACRVTPKVVGKNQTPDSTTF